MRGLLLLSWPYHTGDLWGLLQTKTAYSSQGLFYSRWKIRNPLRVSSSSRQSRLMTDMSQLPFARAVFPARHLA